MSTSSNPRLACLVRGEDLDEEEAGKVVGDIMDGRSSPVQVAALLSAMAAKGESVPEIVGAARAMRDRSLHVQHELPAVLDVCGTGGDGANTINVSTCVAFVAAAAGVPVAKHGNRAVSGKCGSADLLEACGAEIDVHPELAANMLAEIDFTFLFAQRYHPAMKNVAPVRRELGIRTMFNVLGPLTNPARATHHLVGVAHKAHVRLMGEALRALGVQRGAVVHASNGIDEIAGDSPTEIYTFDGDSVAWSYLDPKEFGINVPLAEIQADSLTSSVDQFRAILIGKPVPAAKVVALNAALALTVSGKTVDVAAGLALAFDVLQSGAAYDTFERVKGYKAA